MGGVPYRTVPAVTTKAVAAPGTAITTDTLNTG
jgi:hypothetical protein